MFKQITKVASIRQNFQSAFTRRLSKNGFYNPLIKSSTFCFSNQSQLVVDFNQMRGASDINQQQDIIKGNDFVSKLKDYEVDIEDSAVSIQTDLTDAQIKDYHPTEYTMHEQRIRGDVYSQLEPGHLILTNLPAEISLSKIKELVLQTGVNGENKNIHILNIRLVKALKDDKVAYAKIKLGSAQEVKNVLGRLRNMWLDDKLLKLKTIEDKNNETFDNRTIVLREIPVTYKENTLIDIMSQFGAVVGIELPMYNKKLQDLSYEKKGEVDAFTRERKEKQDRDYQKAQQSVKEKLNTDQEYREFLESVIGAEKTQDMITAYNEVGQETATGANIIDNYKYQSLSSAITRLQFEEKQAGDSLQMVRQLQCTLVTDKDVPSITGGAGENVPTWKEEIQSKRESLKKTLDYLVNNADEQNQQARLELMQRLYLIQSDQTESLDPIDRLQKLSRSELASAYDQMVLLLDRRMELIEKRIKEQIHFIGDKDRILFQKKNPNQENEDIQTFKDPYQQESNIEEVLSASEQIQNIRDYKANDPENKLYLMLKDQYNPFNEQSVNFENNNDLAHSKSRSLDKSRIVPNLSTEAPPSVARAILEQKPFKTEIVKKIQKQVKKLRNEADTPFDELYHKEKSLIQEIILAEKALSDKEKGLPNPMGDRIVNLREVLADNPDIILGSEYETESQFIRDQRKQNEKIFRQSLNDESSTSSKSKNINFEIQNEQNQIQKMLENGTLSEKDHDIWMKQIKQNQEVNMGYVFITFSHSVLLNLMSNIVQDEAKKALLVLENAVIDGVLIQSHTKGALDHKDLDMKYQINKSKNDSKLVDEIQKLREAKKNLKDFEKNIDKELPSTKRLKQYRELAKELIEDPNSKTRNNSQYNARTPEEEEQLKLKMRQMQKDNPDVDYTQLFETERSEQARKALHQKALASYKTFEFLKNGVELSKKTLKEQQNQKNLEKLKRKDIDPYNFPPLEETVGRLLTKDKFPRVLNAGDSNAQPGRKFIYTEQDFLESYLGKDFARVSLSKDPHSQLFGYNEDLKHKYPFQKLLQVPRLEEKSRIMNEAAGPINIETWSKLKDDLLEAEKNLADDVKHPREPNRTFLTDMESRIGAYIEKREKQGKETWFTRDVALIRSELRDEYFPQPPKFKKRRWVNRYSDVLKRPHTKANLPPKVDIKQTERFEPFFEGQDEPDHLIDSIEESNDAQPSRERKDKQNSNKLSKEKKQKSADGVEQYQVSFNDPTLLNDEVRDKNREFLYDLKQKKDLNIPINNGKQMKEYQTIADTKNEPVEDLYEQVKDYGNISQDVQYGSGELKKEVKLGFDQQKLQDHRINNARERGQYKDVKEYAQEDSESEREEDDLYKHYQEQMKKQQKLNASEQRLEHENQQKLKEMQTKGNLEQHIPESPRFKDFFESQSKGKHPFDEDKYKFNLEEAEDDLAQKEYEENKDKNEAEEDYDKEQYDRELQGRLMGEKLTPRQFALLYKAQNDEHSTLKYQRTADRQLFIDHRDEIRLTEELLEQFRRRQVKEGKWKESESKQMLLKEIQIAKKEQVSPHRESQIRKEFPQMLQLLKNIPNPESLFEDEYHFDEGLGQSLKEHVDNLKQNFPEMSVLTRRDRDGYPIVKIQFKPTYKYDLNKILEFDPETANVQMKETFELLTKDMFNSSGKSLADMDKKDLEGIILGMHNAQNKNNDLDANTKYRLKELVQERMNGKFKNDEEGFLQKYEEIQENAKLKTNNTGSRSPLNILSSQNDIKNEVIEQLQEDRMQMSVEIAEQITDRIKEHQNMKARSQGDFARGRRSETSIYGDQIKNQENTVKILDKKMSGLVSKQEENEGYDKEEFLELKREIKLRKEAKQRLLQQGFPEFKPYLTV